jgi:hypothetical protein
LIMIFRVFQYLWRNRLEMYESKQLKALRVAATPRISRQSAHEGGKVVGPKHRPPLPQELFLVLNSVRGWVDPSIVTSRNILFHIQGSSVTLVTGLRSGVSSPVGTSGCIFSKTSRPPPGPHTASYAMGTGFFPRGKAAGAWSLPLNSL